MELSAMRNIGQKAKETISTWIKKAVPLVLFGLFWAAVLIALAVFIVFWDTSTETVAGIVIVLAVAQIVTPLFAAWLSDEKAAAYNEKVIERLEELVKLQNSTVAYNEKTAESLEELVELQKMTISYNEKVIERLEELVELQKSRNDEN